MKILYQIKRSWRWVWTVPALAWLAVTSWRPFVLGFYHDDWVTLQELPRKPLLKAISKELTDQASRPLYGLLAVFLRTVLPFNPIIWHILLALLVAASAFAIGVFSARLAKHITQDVGTARWSGALAAATWIAIPWDLGATAWPTTFAAQISAIGFCALGYVTIGEEALKAKAMKAMIIFTVILLISELFWLSFIPLTLIFLAVEPKGQGSRHRWREAIVLSSGLSVAQLLVLGLNRTLVYVSPATSRSFNPIWMSSVFLSLRLLPVEFERALLWPRTSWAIICIAFAIPILGAVFHPKRKLIVATFFAIVGGGFLSLVLFAVAGYRVEAIGIFSRTTVVISVWFCLIPALTVAVSEYFGTVIQRLALGAGLLLIAIFSISSINNLQAWIKSWKFEEQLLNAFPAVQIAQGAARNSFVLVDAEHPATYGEGFEAFWDISGALYVSYPFLREEFTPDHGYRQFAAMANRSKMQTSWDGTILVQSWCTSPQSTLWTLDAPADLYLWKPSAQQLLRLSAPAKLGCERQ